MALRPRETGHCYRRHYLYKKFNLGIHQDLKNSAWFRGFKIHGNRTQKLASLTCLRSWIFETWKHPTSPVNFTSLLITSKCLANLTYLFFKHNKNDRIRCAAFNQFALTRRQCHKTFWGLNLINLSCNLDYFTTNKFYQIDLRSFSLYSLLPLTTWS